MKKRRCSVCNRKVKSDEGVIVIQNGAWLWCARCFFAGGPW